jgi:predicted O-methyltransferase YrrM
MRLRRLAVRIVGPAIGAGIVAAMLVAAASAVGLGSMAGVAPVGIVVATVVTSLLMLREWAHRLDERLSMTQGRLSELDLAVQDAAAAAAFSVMDMPFPPALGGHWALGWDGAVILAREIAVAKPGAVVELGAGASSLVIGHQLRRAGRGHLYTLEHDAAFADVTRRQVSAFGLDPWVTVLDAPLEDLELDGDRYRWYRVPDAVRDLERIDVVVVDGPPQRTDPEGMPRYPALPVLGGKLGPGALVFIDDARRDGERRMLARWLETRPDWSVRTLKTRHGTVLLTRPGAVGG